MREANDGVLDRARYLWFSQRSKGDPISGPLLREKALELNKKLGVSADFKTKVYNGGCGSPVVKVSDHGRHVMSSSPVPLKTRREGQRCTFNLPRAEMSSRWCGVEERREGCQLRCRPSHLTMAQNCVVRRQKPSYS
ncbi:uncharacterized protein TNCV_1319051 [Trichonephila clavipes]|nr:uncharacterized protein TNCV_1319051 [Trichonephila clavipes]